ncbi:unnamed protein product [Lactuca virosa]|uniref:DUF659 domain-containing protein n=1 Tax=Lactuca virosa TaxID=75947 RepID=A0AAU9MGM9_9ASTR|nr:unnamed protein product [Lactuca virosa]
MINEVIKDVGEENIVQFITDNGSNFKAAGMILEEQHPKLFWTPCAAHCVNLMIGDIGEKIPKIKNTLADARAIVVYIYNYGRILNLMRKLTKNKELHRSCVTRFATQFYTIQSIHENRHHIQVLFVSEEWKKSDFAKKSAGKKVERIVAKHEFLDIVHFTCQVLAHLVDVVRLVDMEEKPCMGYIYDAVDRAKEQIKKNLTGTPNERMITRLWAMIQARWSDQLHHPLHAAGCYLNPAIFHGENSREIRKNRDIATGLYVAIDRLVPDNDDNDKLRQDLNLYIDLVGQFGSPAAIRARTKVAPYIWWRTYGIDPPLLQNFAITVLSQTCSASPCERNWSVFDNLHSKKRNCFLQQKLNDLVFIQYNTIQHKRWSLWSATQEAMGRNEEVGVTTRSKREWSLWSATQEAMGRNEEVGVTTRSKREWSLWSATQEAMGRNEEVGVTTRSKREWSLWSATQEAMGRNEEVGVTTRSKRERYRDDVDDDIRIEVNHLDEQLDALVDVDSEEDFMAYD